MNILYEDLYTSGVDVKFCTTNGVIKNTGELVMGAGTAKIIKDLYPNSPQYFGNQITKTYTKRNGVYKYGILVDSQNNIGILQTKYHFKDSSDIELIEYSLNKLTLLANKNLRILFGIPFPGIGLGNLSNARQEIEYMLEGLPSNIFIFEK